MNLINRIILRKQDPVFTVAKKLIDDFNKRTENSVGTISAVFPYKEWFKVIDDKNDEFGRKSPEMMQIDDEGIMLISFPEKSKPYSDKITTKVKNCFIVKGVLYDENNPDPDFCYVAGDRFKVYPWQNVRPYTKDGPVLAIVELE